MARPKTTGTCAYCKGMFAKSGMARHLAACSERQVVTAQTSALHARFRPAQWFHLQIEGAPNSEYWMHVEARGDLSLADLDGFLRRTWLECCGHLSLFRINGELYTGDWDNDFDSQTMNVPLEQLLTPGLSFGHEYDFGSTTELKLKVIDERTGTAHRRAIKIMAQNEPPEHKCALCDSLATQICPVCNWYGENPDAWLCDKHADTHPCGAETLLPVVNSPRTGVCGYTGPITELWGSG